MNKKNQLQQIDKDQTFKLLGGTAKPPSKKREDHVLCECGTGGITKKGADTYEDECK
jgi:hypothetical protein